jgi:glucokinase
MRFAVPEEIRALAIDVGGSHATCAIVRDQEVLAREYLPISDAGAFGVLLPALAEILRSLLKRCCMELGECIGVALSFPGIADPVSSRILATPKGKFDDAASLDFSAWAHDRLTLPIRVENDARMALLGEQHAGAAQACGDVVMVTLGTGVGTAVMMGGHILRGRHFQAGCLGGHLPARFDGRECICGSIGCVEAEASTWALPAICRSWPGFAASGLAREPVLDFAALFRYAEAGDPVATQVRDHCLHVWAAGAVGLIHAYDPELLVFGGSVMKSSEQILPFLKTYTSAHAWMSWGKVRLCASPLGGEAPLFGAIPLLRETW